MNKLLTILGPTAIGKTRLAVHLAEKLNGEIISADSRQVYRNMDIGTGKDLNEYQLNGKPIPYHLIDIAEPGDHYDVFQFQQDFYSSFNQIIERNAIPILCGGSGMYLQAALNKEGMIPVEKNKRLRQEIIELSQDDLLEKLKSLQPELHNETDSKDRERTIRAIEIALAQREQKEVPKSPVDQFLIIGLNCNREELRARIKSRMEKRFNSGMLEEVEALMKKGIDLETLRYYGLEYRWIGEFLEGLIDRSTMEEKLLQGIRRFAKKQITWFRRMERQGFEIHWIEATLPLDQQLEMALDIIDGQF